MTVIDGLAAAAPAAQSHAVLVARTTYRERYESARALEYEPGPYVSAPAARADAVAARAGWGKPFLEHSMGDAMDHVPDDAAALMIHNGPFLARHAPKQIPTILYAHNEVLPGAVPWVASRACHGFEGVVAVSSWLAERLAPRMPARLRQNVQVVLNGVDTTAFSPSERSGDRDRVRVLFLGRVVREKGPDLVLSACRLLARHDLEVRIVGSAGFSPGGALSSYEQILRRTAADLPGAVSFVPFTERSEVAAHYRWADIVALPSRWDDPCPLTTLEAMACGAATIVADSGGMPECAGDGALVVPKNDSSRLAEVIEALLDDQTLRQQWGERGRQRAELLSWTTASAKLTSTVSAFAT
ncbi:glycosyltransferase family 4 protein [Terrabacter sp. RAF57]|uniref:glycosyltransferase family 4 protein n=1 Tax=Terrabacter sp. RAF57 TaxID=3233063 RepID=UPI003F961A1C